MSELDHCVDSLPLNPRIDAYLARLYIGHHSRQEIKEALTEGRLFLNGKTAKPRDLVKAADRITGCIGGSSEPAAPVAPTDVVIDIVYEDADLAVINKASGMVVHPGAGNKSGTLVHALAGRGTALSNL
ncbi:MAG: S4 domain-containing protein, partial [Candidatus Omnitrophota bacterium]